MWTKKIRDFIDVDKKIEKSFANKNSEFERRRIVSKNLMIYDTEKDKQLSINSITIGKYNSIHMYILYLNFNCRKSYSADYAAILLLIDDSINILRSITG